MIFISHRQADEQKAKQMAELLRGKGVQYYLDVLDPATKTASDITQHIMSTLDKCSHVIVMFSNNTEGSMWVPFELGAAYKGGKGIGTYLLDQIKTPEYLNTFPKMRSSYDVDKFVEEYRSDQNRAKSRTNDRSIRLDEFVDSSNAESFIRRLKNRLGQ